VVLRLTASAAARGAAFAAAHLSAAGVNPGDRVAVALPVTTARPVAARQHLQLVTLVLGMLRVGIVPVLVNPLLPEPEQAYVIEDCDPVLVVNTDRQLADLVALTNTIGTELSQELIARPMHYTSGTTGVPKGVWTGFLPSDSTARWWADELDQWEFDAKDSTLVHGPLAHSGPLRFALLTLMSGGSVLLPGGFEPSVIARILSEQKPTAAFVVPTHLQRLFELGDLPPSPYRVLAHAGSACPPELKRRTHEWAGAQSTWEFYGATEGQFTSCRGTQWEERPGTLGQARLGRRVFTDDGVIWCQTPDYSAFEYWHDPDKTASAWRTLPDGTRAFSVGDLGRIDDDGFLWLDSRREDLIITGGVNVYPAQVEAVLMAHPNISDAAVFAADDDRWGQRVCAAVVTDASERQLRADLEPMLAPYQRPKTYVTLDELPRNAMGKVQRNLLGQRLA
jgi:long-chain acyl-CoA synthetase